MFFDVAAARRQTAMIECKNVRIRARHCDAVTTPLCPRTYQRRAVGLLRRASADALLGKLPSIYPYRGYMGKLGKLLSEVEYCLFSCRRLEW